MSDIDFIMVALAIVSIIALFAICVAVKKARDADFYKMMWEGSNRQNDRLFDRVKELQDSMAKKGASPAVYDIGDRIVIGDRIYKVMDGGAMTRGEPVLTLEARNDE